jgi:hypothetical protein
MRQSQFAVIRYDQTAREFVTAQVIFPDDPCVGYYDENLSIKVSMVVTNDSPSLSGLLASGAIALRFQSKLDRREHAEDRNCRRRVRRVLQRLEA